MFKQLQYKNTFLILILYTFLSVGCFWQTFTVFKMYFNYPTNIQIETKFNAFERPLPVMTFCGWASLAGSRMSQDTFDGWKLQDVIAEISIGHNKMTDYFINTAIESITQNDYCFTINSPLKGKNKFCKSYSSYK